MPIACDPNQLLPVQLESDAALAPEYRATFHYRALTVSQHRERAGLLERALKSDDGAAARVLLDQAITIGLSGWDNLRRPDGTLIAFQPGAEAAIAALDGSLNPDEKWSLALETAAAVRLAVSDKKKSASPATSASVSSAASAATPAAASSSPPKAKRTRSRVPRAREGSPTPPDPTPIVHLGE